VLLNTNVTGKGYSVRPEDMRTPEQLEFGSTWVIFIWKNNKAEAIACLMI
jgi:hypothetical protein